MADFRQLALEFVLADDEANQTSLAQQAASELQSAPANTNPVARWVEAVQPWMPGSNGDEATGDNETPDWTGRAKVKLLISFFGAMFDVDHKAGVLASATALSRITEMKSFQPTSADDIIQKICTLKDDFPRQLAKTRLAVFELLRSLITNPAVASDLQYKHGASSGFMNDLLALCRNERDPTCLMVWFDVLAFFLQEYEPSQEMIEEVFNTFKAYFPITLPRTSTSGITPEELKQQLRKCFTSTHKLASFTFPFLLGKLDQGEGVTVNVKVDILKTVKACAEAYKIPEQTVNPYVDSIWSSLKYEVRNGEIEDTIWATLEVLKIMAVRLKGDNLRDYALTVTRDCVNDLANAVYTAPAGRLLVSVLSATPSAFVLMASPAITHVKENLRHPKGPGHSGDLLRILHVMLETRLLLVSTDMGPQERSEFAAIDPVFTSLYDDVYKKPLEQAIKSEASYDDHKLAAQAVQGAGALVCQKAAKSTAVADVDASRLLPGDKCLAICDTLFSILEQTRINEDLRRTTASDELASETTKALQRSVTSYNPAYVPLVRRGLDIIRSARKTESSQSVSTAQSLGLLLAYVGCSELPAVPSQGLDNFILITKAMYLELIASIEEKSTLDSEWVSSIAQRYTGLEEPHAQPTTATAAASPGQVRTDFLLISLYFVRQLYQRATKPSGTRLGLSGEFGAMEEGTSSQLLHLLGGLAGFVVHELSEAEQLSLGASSFAMHLFHEDAVPVPQAGAQVEPSEWSWIATSRLNVLTFGILEALRPAAVAQLYDAGVAQAILIQSVTSNVSSANPTTAFVLRAILTILANKHKLETVEPVMEIINQQAEVILSGEADNSTLTKATSMFAIAAGMLRRYSGKHASGLLRLLRESSKSSALGQSLSRRLEMVVAPQKTLTKNNFAIVKPLWMQKLYFELAKSMTPQALGQDSSVQDRVIRLNLSIGTLMLVEHMPFSIYEEDAEGILRIAIFVAQTIGTGPDVVAALNVLRNILVEASAKGEPHLASIIAICTAAFSSKPHVTPEWLPASYASASVDDVESQAESCEAALEIMGGLPKMFESRHLVPSAPKVERELTLACGNPVRNVRKLARAARAAWKELR
ncbi:MMS19 nucleotide excision repair protein-like protein [Emericellopsis cladophorae]|uniref:MMS19 nucleotide excision repair protein n=1 Tax=Emericellopsis cladophorae TaxID=2686198 RepID=A0A9P9XYK7_9HYPO|nr:MMS19 nucleotide excision repair protein-like protein [Emericellopsis cladophorae]KAI6779714.1 MMS19 nucleotide excision repair protein-like protein [Emericellopsis cladophorae]